MQRSKDSEFCRMNRGNGSPCCCALRLNRSSTMRRQVTTQVKPNTTRIMMDGGLWSCIFGQLGPCTEVWFSEPTADRPVCSQDTAAGGETRGIKTDTQPPENTHHRPADSSVRPHVYVHMLSVQSALLTRATHLPSPLTLTLKFNISG